MKRLMALWKLVDGKKTMIASLYWGFVMPSLAVMYPEGVPPEINKWVVIVGFFLTSVGLGHKWYKRSTLPLLLVGVLALGVGSGCSKKTTTIDMMDTPRPSVVEPAPEPRRTPVEAPVEAVVVAPDPVTVQFDFDSYALSLAAENVLRMWAENNPDVPVVVAGGCCPIGTVEYNDGLGLKRAQVVADVLEDCGVSVVAVTSYGESNLVAHDPNEYYRNRRAEVQPK